MTFCPYKLASEGSERDMPAVEQQGRHSTVQNSFLITNILGEKTFFNLFPEEVN